MPLIAGAGALAAAAPELILTPSPTCGMSATPGANPSQPSLPSAEVNEPVGAFLGVPPRVRPYSSRLRRGAEQLTRSEQPVIEAGGIHAAMLSSVSLPLHVLSLSLPLSLSLSPLPPPSLPGLCRAVLGTLDADNSLHKTRALASTYISQLSGEIEREQGGLSTESGEDRTSIETLYAAIPFLAKITDDGDGDEMDRVVQRTIDMEQGLGARAIRRPPCRTSTAGSLTPSCSRWVFGRSLASCSRPALPRWTPPCPPSPARAAKPVVFLIDLSMPFHGFVQVDVQHF